MSHKKNAAPTGGELETALLELLRKNQFPGPEDISVFVVGPEATPIYILTLGAEVAKALADLLVPILGGRSYQTLTEWVLFRPDAEAILEAARNVS